MMLNTRLKNKTNSIKRITKKIFIALINEAFKNYTGFENNLNILATLKCLQEIEIEESLWVTRLL
jgi:hypothetical protein